MNSDMFMGGPPAQWWKRFGKNINSLLIFGEPTRYCGKYLTIPVPLLAHGITAITVDFDSTYRGSIPCGPM